MQAQQRGYFEAGRAVLAEMSRVLEPALALRDDVSAILVVTTSYFAVRTHGNYRAILTLCEHDLGVEAQAITRVLVEDAIDLRYISTNSEVLATEWAEHSMRRRYYLWKQQISMGIEPEVPPEMDEMLQLIERDKERARARGKKARPLKNQWTTLNLRERAKAGNLVDGYVFYEWLCEHTHGSGLFAGDYLAAKDGRMHVVPDQRGYKSVTPLYLATWFAAFAFLALNELALEERLNVYGVANRYVDMSQLPDDLHRDLGQASKTGLFNEQAGS